LCEEYWLPTPFAGFPFTSPPVRHRLLPHFNWNISLYYLFFVFISFKGYGFYSISLKDEVYSLVSCNAFVSTKMNKM